MEASAALEMVVDLAKEGIGVEFVVSDDDSTMRANLHHIGTHKNGKLPTSAHQPKFLCDPSHRIKVMVKDIFALALQSKTKSNAEKIDAMRLKKYCGCWIGKSKLLPFDQFKKLSKAPVEHLFNCHEWCDASWCFSVELDEAQEKMQTATTEAPTHPQLLPLVARRSQFALPPRSLVLPYASLVLLW